MLLGIVEFNEGVDGFTSIFVTELYTPARIDGK
jgi:hypothetical protein